MCIRDREKEIARLKQKLATSAGGDLTAKAVEIAGVKVLVCLLYTSDAADERSSVDLGGRRIIKKKKKSNNSRCMGTATENQDQERATAVHGLQATERVSTETDR